MTLEEAKAEARRLFDEWKNNAARDDDYWQMLGNNYRPFYLEPQAHLWDLNLRRAPYAERPVAILYPDWIHTLPEPVWTFSEEEANDAG